MLKQDGPLIVIATPKLHPSLKSAKHPAGLPTLLFICLIALIISFGALPAAAASDAPRRKCLDIYVFFSIIPLTESL